MKKLILLSVFCLLVLVAVSPAEAHPGNTAADGCHYCRTNCDKWGVAWNERHCHGGGSAPAPVAESAPIVQNTPIPTAVYVPPTIAPVRRVAATVVPTKKPTNIPPTKSPTRIPTKKPTAKPTKIATPTITKEPTPSSKAQPAERAIEVQTENEKGFWYRFFSFFTGN